MPEYTADAPSLNAEEQGAIARARATAQQLATAIGVPLDTPLSPLAVGRMGEPTVMMLVLTPINLNLEGGRRVRFNIGLQPVPASLADHWWILKHGDQVRRYGPGPAVGQAMPMEPEPPAPPPAPTLDDVRNLQSQLTEMQRRLDAKPTPTPLVTELSEKNLNLEIELAQARRALAEHQDAARDALAAKAAAETRAAEASRIAEDAQTAAEAGAQQGDGTQGDGGDSDGKRGGGKKPKFS